MSQKCWFDHVCRMLLFDLKKLDREFVQRMEVIIDKHPYATWEWRTTNRDDRATEKARWSFQ